MHNARRKKLPYITPYVVLGVRISCVVRGLVKIVRMSEGTIPWPVGELDHSEALVVYKGLERALSNESAMDIAAWWAVPVEQVRQWQQVLGVPVAKHPSVAPPEAEVERDPPASRRKARPKEGDEDEDGRPRPFTEQHDAIVRVVAPEVAARKLRRSVRAVEERREALGLDSYQTVREQTARPRRDHQPWEPWEDVLVASVPVAEAARKTGRKTGAITARRYRLVVTRPRGSKRVQAD